MKRTTWAIGTAACLLSVASCSQPTSHTSAPKPTLSWPVYSEVPAFRTSKLDSQSAFACADVTLSRTVLGSHVLPMSEAALKRAATTAYETALTKALQSKITAFVAKAEHDKEATTAEAEAQLGPRLSSWASFCNAHGMTVSNENGENLTAPTVTLHSAFSATMGVAGG